MYTGDVPVNVAMYRLVKEKLSEYYMLTLCPARKIELAISDAFKESALNNTCSQNYVNIYCLFRRANLRWWLFKSKLFLKILNTYVLIALRAPNGLNTKEMFLNSHLHDLVVLIGVCNNQIISPHSDAIKKN